ncbi:hypothetical protein B296_00042743 [Ensete ventricosum]|uniref:Uncharacterized protein n=1 Tax=Ensete ventricosum TaxID=4639 RepID=A0A426YT53_ENSVE|nr:hypothetical protein B296_00042743 [Ensete ventricosum]
MLFNILVSNLLFVESPAGVGWSYSNTTSDYNRDDESTGMLTDPISPLVLNYSYTDGNINILPLLKRIVKHQIPVWVFR